MRRSTISGRIQPIDMAMRKSTSFSYLFDRRLQRQGAFRSRSPRPTREASQPSRLTGSSTLRRQLLRVAASEDGVRPDIAPDPSTVDTEAEYDGEMAVPPPATPRHQSSTSRRCIRIKSTSCPMNFSSALTVSNAPLKIHTVISNDFYSR